MVNIHNVKCLICNTPFDRDKVPFVQIGRRYAHQTCYNNKNDVAKQMEDKDRLMDLIKDLYGENANWALIMKQMKEYEKKVASKEYTYTGMMKTLIYVYKVKKMSIEDGNGGIGIIPYQYQEASRYYYDLWVKQENAKRTFNPKVLHPEEVVINIKEPQLKPKRRKLFTFLDEEIDNGQ